LTDVIANDRLLRVASWNVQHGGHSSHRAGGNQDRRHLAVDILRGYKPHILLFQEMTHGALDGCADVHELATALGLFQGFISPAPPESPNPTAVFIDLEMFEVRACYTHASNGWLPITNPVVRLRGEPQTSPISLASVHLCAYDPATREREARRLITIADGGRSVLFGGDFNSYPHRAEEEQVPLPDWSVVPNANLFHHRTVLSPGGQPVSDTRPDQILAGPVPGGHAVFVELGHYAGTQLLQPDGFKATANLWSRKPWRQSRLDRFYATQDVADALVSVEVIDGEDVAAVSDHALVLASFDLDILRETLTPTASASAA
jgi:endonuclease/exonuclease/phosphatase family metal-dependent hydrolase